MTDNSWYERGEFPPKGTECEVKYRDDWERCVIIDVAKSKNRIDCIFKTDDDWDWVCSTDAFRPLKYDRDKAIEAGMNALDIKELGCIEWQCHARRVIENLYDAGMLTVPEQK